MGRVLTGRMSQVEYHRAQYWGLHFLCYTLMIYLLPYRQSEMFLLADDTKIYRGIFEGIDCEKLQMDIQ